MRKHCASKHQETLDIEKTSGEKNVSATVVGQFVAKSSSHEKWPRHPHASLGAFEPSVVTGPDVSSKSHPKFMKISSIPDLSRGFIKFPKLGGFQMFPENPHHPEIAASWTPPPRGAKAASSKAVPLGRRQPGEPRGGVGGWNHPKSMGWRIIVYIIHHPKSMVNINQLCW